MSQDIVFYKKF